MAYKFPDLPYSYDALEPYIDEETMHLHHDKHHKSYIDKLNEALKDYPQYNKYDPEVLVTNWKKLPKAIQDSVRNQGGGVVHHSLFWTFMKKDGGGPPTGELAKQINKDFGSFDKFKKKFNEVGTKRFGSGWVWLIYNKEKLQIVSLPNQDSPLTNGDIPIMGNDLFEHAYYLKYYNERDKYLEAWWNVINWEVIDARFHKAKVFSAHKLPKTTIKKQYGL
jgi:Fe-Mn family superoxide dismutase